MERFFYKSCREHANMLKGRVKLNVNYKHIVMRYKYVLF